MKKALVAYFSASGETARLARTIAGVTGGALFEIAPETAYTAAALSYLVQGSAKPIVLTGAQKPIWFDGTDSEKHHMSQICE